MRKIAVTASASGSGKSTVGRALAERLGVPCVELDALVHGPNWTEIRRTVRRWRHHEELWNGNRESLRDAIGSRDALIQYAARAHFSRRRRCPAELEPFNVVRLRTQADVDGFVRDAGAL
jgi:hypothetical protein